MNFSRMSLLRNMRLASAIMPSVYARPDRRRSRCPIGARFGSSPVLGKAQGAKVTQILSNCSMSAAGMLTCLCVNGPFS